MRLHRFFIEEVLRNKKEVTLREDELIHQLKDVFRLKSEDKIILLDNTGYEYLAEIIVISKDKIDIKILENNLAESEIEKEIHKKPEIWLFSSLIKKDNYEWVLEKCTELGVSHFVPLISDRTEKKDINKERLEKIIKEASEQSGRGILPLLHDTLSLSDALTHAQKNNLKCIAFHVDGEAFSKEKILKASELEKKLGVPEQNIPLAVFIGPEGGWTDKEISLFKEHNAKIYSLGKLVLRAETAAIAVSTLLLIA